MRLARAVLVVLGLLSMSPMPAGASGAAAIDATFGVDPPYGVTPVYAPKIQLSLNRVVGIMNSTVVANETCYMTGSGSSSSSILSDTGRVTGSCTGEVPLASLTLDYTRLGGAGVISGVYSGGIITAACTFIPLNAPPSNFSVECVAST